MSEVLALEYQREQAKSLIEKRDMAIKLYSNPEFNKLIVKEFCVEEAARLVHQSGDPILKPEERADALAMAQSGGHLRRWLSMTILMGNTAEKQSVELDEAIMEARQEAGE